MTNSTQFNIVRYSAPTPGATQEEYTLTQEQKTPTQLNNNEIYKTDNTASTTQRQSDVYKTTIYGTDPVQAPGGRYTLKEREERIDAYSARVNTQINNIESGSEGERNVKFQNVRLFMEPSGYFSGGLLAAGFDPHEKFTVTFDTYVGMGAAKNLSDTSTRTYFAWEIAAGMLDHDTPGRSGIVNFHGMVIDPKDRSKINDLQSFGKRLQKHWEQDIATPMRGSAKINTLMEITQYLPLPLHMPYVPPKISTVIPERSGKADAYVARGALQSLRSDKEAFEKLSSSGQEAISRTLDKNGQVIIPNIYGYPLSGYAFIPYTPYDGSESNRPNQGVMFDLRSGAVREIKGDDDFAAWAKDNRNQLISRFNARDLQGGKDAHWPPAANVLNSLIRDNNSHYQGRKNLLSDKSIPVRELFNYTQSRDSDYELKFGDLYKGIASHYQEVNAKNALWADQTKVFGAVEQGWKAAREVWGNTFGYVPFLGNAGNIVFGKHDADHGMTASDRVGGTTGAVISGLLLAHEVTPVGIEAGLGESTLNFNASGIDHYNWQYNAQTSEFELARTPEPTTSPGPTPHIEEPAPLEIENAPIENTPIKSTFGDIKGAIRSKKSLREKFEPFASQYKTTGEFQPDAQGFYRIKGEDYIPIKDDGSNGTVLYKVRVNSQKDFELVKPGEQVSENAPLVRVLKNGDFREKIDQVALKRKLKGILNKPSLRHAYEKGLASGDPTKIKYYEKDLQTDQIHALMMEPKRTPEEIGTLMGVLVKRGVTSSLKNFEVFKAKVEAAGGSAVGIPQTFYLQNVSPFNDGECAGLVNTMALAIEHNKEDIFIENLFKATVPSKDPAILKFRKNMKTLQANTEEHFHGRQPVRQGPYTEIVPELSSATETKMLRVSSMDHGILVGVIIRDGKKTFFIYDPNFGMARFPTSEALKEGLDNLLSGEGTPTIQFHRTYDGKDPNIPEYKRSEFSDADLIMGAQGVDPEEFFDAPL
ncbi:hypothetical protein [Pseudomonas khavaziana]|uniref:Peptidase C58 YopT-type domain-containing protein n=1 Tax=Pseudomonas khavaziana TaxID=2842351 RepID=A0ABZ2DMQ6_9PSED